MDDIPISLKKYKDIEKRRKYKIEWNKKHPPNKFYRDSNKKRQQRYSWNLKRRAFEKIGGCRCIKCGITDLRILTINHKNSDGKKERKSRRGLLLDIVTGRRPINDLEVRCYNCNILYEYEIKRLSNPL